MKNAKNIRFWGPKWGFLGNLQRLWHRKCLGQMPGTFGHVLPWGRNDKKKSSKSTAVGYFKKEGSVGLGFLFATPDPSLPLGGSEPKTSQPTL